MSGPAPTPAPVPPPGGPDWRVRPAEPHEAPAVAAAVAQLLRELGSTPPDAAAMEDAARQLLEDAAIGAVFVAEASDGEIIGVLAASWQLALHVPGRYATIQDLWVAPGWRSQSVGAALLDALVALTTALGIPRAEVGIPRDEFPGLELTRSFYLRNGFEHLGARLRRRIP